MKWKTITTYYLFPNADHHYKFSTTYLKYRTESGLASQLFKAFRYRHPYLTKKQIDAVVANGRNDVTITKDRILIIIAEDGLR